MNYLIQNPFQVFKQGFSFLNLHWKKFQLILKIFALFKNIVIQLRGRKDNVIRLRADQSGLITWIAVLCFEICGEQDFLVMSADLDWKETLI